ncbi:cobalt ECF transporter T component CbiQ [Synechococcus sp. PCC 6717]|jgi:cobalt/nickel transport system permease protein|nr:cobalt ECF transporter T component CbiQ [Synechococcus sp. PCC 6716]MCI3281843.1 cobalt ECF transporter T component CbiQ [Synechococcus sp. PCC 6717]
MHHHLDSYAYRNGLRHIPPEQKLLFAIALLLFTFFAHPLSQGLLWLWLSVWVVGYARIPWRVYAAVLGAIALFWVLSLPSLLVQVAPTSLVTTTTEPLLGRLSVGGWSVFIPQAQVTQALGVGLRTLVASSCLVFILFTTPFPELLGVLERRSVPSFLLDILMLMYRYIFILLDTAVSLQLAQRARGGYQRRSRWLYSLSLLAAQLFRQSLQRYQGTNLALLSRGFTGQFRVWRSPPYAYSQRYAVEAGLGGGLLLLVNRILG